MEHARFSLWVACLLLCGCTPAPPAEPKPQKAGQPISRVETAARMATIQGAAILGDEETIKREVARLQDDFRRSIKLADPARRVDREAARSAAKTVDGVRSVAWIDHENLLAIVARNEQRSYATIDAICLQLEPLGDTLGVVVNLQSGAATTGDELEILSRNCQLPPGERAFLQRNRQVDVIAPELRAQHQASRRALEAHARDREAEAAESLRILEASTPEM